MLEWTSPLSSLVFPLDPPPIQGRKHQSIQMKTIKGHKTTELRCVACVLKVEREKNSDTHTHGVLRTWSYTNRDRDPERESDRESDRV